MAKGRFVFIWLQFSAFVPAMAYLWNHQQSQVISRGPQPPQDFSHASYWQHETPAPLLPPRAQPVMHSPQLPQYSVPHVQPQPYRRPLSPGVSTAPLEVEPLEAELLTTTAPRPPLPLPVRHPPPAYHVPSPYQRPPNPPATWKAGVNYNAQQEVTGSSAPSHVKAFHLSETQLSVQRPQLKPLTEEENTFLRNLSSLTQEQKWRLVRLPPSQKRTIQLLIERAMLLEKQTLQQQSATQALPTYAALPQAQQDHQPRQQPEQVLQAPTQEYPSHPKELERNQQASWHWQPANGAQQRIPPPELGPTHPSERMHYWQPTPTPTLTTPRGEVEKEGPAVTTSTPLPSIWPALSGHDYVPPPPPRVGTGPVRPGQPQLTQPGQPQPAHAPIGLHAHHVQSVPQTYVAQHVAPTMHSAQAMGPSAHSYSQQQQPAYSSHGGWGSYSPAASDTGSPHDIFSSRFNVQAFQHGYIQAFVTTVAPPTQSPGSGTWGAGEWGQVGFNMNAAVPATTLPPTTTTTPSHMIAVNPAGIQAGFYIGPNPRSLDPTKQNRPKPTTQIIETIHQGSAADLAGGFFGNTPPPPTTTTPPLPGRDGNHMAGWLGFNGDQPTEPPASKARNEVSNQGFQSFFPVPGVDTQNTNQVSTGTGQNSAGKSSSQTVQNALSTLLQNLKGNPQLLSSVLSQIGSQPVRK